MPSKYEILSEIAETHPDLQHELAAKHKGILVDCFCRTPRCDGRILRHYVERTDHRDWNADNEVRYIVCPKCAVRGNWDTKEVIPPPQEQIAKTKKLLEDKANNARKLEIEAIDKQIESLRNRRNQLEPLEDAEFKPEA